MLDNDQELIQLDLTSRPQNQNGSTCKYKTTLATVQYMHTCKSGAMEKTGPIPRFEIIGRFNLSNVPHAISWWTTYVTMVKCTVLETNLDAG